MQCGHNAVDLMLVVDEQVQIQQRSIPSYVYCLNLCSRKVILKLEWASRSPRVLIKPECWVQSPRLPDTIDLG